MKVRLGENLVSNIICKRSFSYSIYNEPTFVYSGLCKQINHASAIDIITLDVPGKF